MEKTGDLKVIVSPRLSASSNMEIDRALFERSEKGFVPPTLRVFSWLKPSVSLGYSQNIESEIDLSKAQMTGIDVVKRPTGGGMVFHGLSDISFSFAASVNGDSRVIPDKISLCLVSVLAHLGIRADISLSRKRWNSKHCFSLASKNEINVNGKKLVGVAFRRGRRGILAQGSFFVRDDVFSMADILRSGIDHGEYETSASSIEKNIGRVPDFDELSRILISVFEKNPF